MPNVSDPDNEYEKQGVTFKIISDDMVPKVDRYTLTLIVTDTEIKSCRFILGD